MIDSLEAFALVLCVTQKEKLKYADLIEQFANLHEGKKIALVIYKENGQPQKYYDILEEQLKYQPDQYLELIDYYEKENLNKAIEIGERGLKKCQDQKTDLMIRLMELMNESGDIKKFQKMLNNAKKRTYVDDKKIQEYFAQLDETSHLIDILSDA